MPQQSVSATIPTQITTAQQTANYVIMKPKMVTGQSLSKLLRSTG